MHTGPGILFGDQGTGDWVSLPWLNVQEVVPHFTERFPTIILSLPSSLSPSSGRCCCRAKRKDQGRPEVLMWHVRIHAIILTHIMCVITPDTLGPGEDRDWIMRSLILGPMMDATPEISCSLFDFLLEISLSLSPKSIREPGKRVSSG